MWQHKQFAEMTEEEQVMATKAWRLPEDVDAADAEPGSASLADQLDIRKRMVLALVHPLVQVYTIPRTGQLAYVGHVCNFRQTCPLSLCVRESSRTRTSVEVHSKSTLTKFAKPMLGLRILTRIIVTLNGSSPQRSRGDRTTCRWAPSAKKILVWKTPCRSQGRHSG